MTDYPFFSIVVPTYNRSEILINTITSILKQHFKDFEIVVVDDGSTDDTSKIIDALSKNEKRIKLFKQINKERGAARNFGLKNSTGTYIVFFDSDDIMHENHLSVLERNIKEQDFPNFIATKFNFINEKGKHFQSDISKLRQGYFDYKLFLNGNPLACNICVKKENSDLFKFVEDRQFSIKEDWMFMLQNLQNKKIFIIDKTTISMFDHADRSMRSNNGKIIQKTKAAYKWILENINLTSLEQAQLSAHVNYFCGIHSYLDDNRKDVYNYIFKAIKFGGLKIKYIVLLLKSMVGRKIFSWLK